MRILHEAIASALYSAHFVKFVGSSLRRYGAVVPFAGKRVHFEDIWFTSRREDATEDLFLPLIAVEDNDDLDEPATYSSFEEAYRTLAEDFDRLRAEGVQVVPKLDPDLIRSLRLRWPDMDFERPASAILPRILRSRRPGSSRMASTAKGSTAFAGKDSPTDISVMSRGR